MGHLDEAEKQCSAHTRQVYRRPSCPWESVGPREKMVPGNVHGASGVAHGASGVATPDGPYRGLLWLRITETLCWQTSTSQPQIWSWEGRSKAGGAV